MLEVPYRIPWLILIQLIVLLLLLALLFFFTVDFSLDPDAANTVVTVTSPAIASTSAKVFLFDEIQQIDKPVITNSQRLTQQGGENLTIKSEIETESNLRREEITEGEEASSSLSFNLWHYFELATVAFLKCFGLDSTSDTSSSNRKRRKRKES